MPGRLQMLWLFVLAAPVACVAWTVTHEEVFSELHEWCVRKSKSCQTIAQRKFFYLFTCEYCFSHYVAGAAVLATDFRMLLPDWRGAILAWLSLVWVANFYMSLFGRLRLDIKRERVEIKAEELEVKREEREERREANATGQAASTPPATSRARRSAGATRQPARPAHRA